MKDMGLRYLLILLTFAGGLLLGITIKNYPIITFDTALDLDDLLNVCTTLFIAYWLSAILPKKFQEGRVEKDMVITELNKYLEDMAILRNEIDDYFIKQSDTQAVDTEQIKVITTKIKLRWTALRALRQLTTDFGFTVTDSWLSYDFPTDFAGLRRAYTRDTIYGWDIYTEGQAVFDKHFRSIRSIVLAINRE